MNFNKNVAGIAQRHPNPNFSGVKLGPIFTCRAVLYVRVRRPQGRVRNQTKPNQTQLNSTQLNSTQLNSTQLIQTSTQLN